MKTGLGSEFDQEHIIRHQGAYNLEKNHEGTEPRGRGAWTSPLPIIFLRMRNDYKNFFRSMRQSIIYTT